MYVPSTGGSSAATNNATSATSASDAATDQAFANMLNGGSASSPDALLQQITSHGVQSMWSWEVQKMESEIAGEVMSQMGVTSAELAKMPADQRAALEEKIMQAVEARVKQLIAQGMQKHDPNTLGLDIDDGTDVTQDVGSTLNLTT